MTKAFVSYASGDASDISKLATVLEGHGLDVWWDRSLIPGQDFREVIDSQLDAADFVLVYWTTASIKSRWVIAEAEHASRQHKLIPLRSADINIDDIPKPFNTLHTCLFNDQDALLSALGKPSAAGRPAEIAPEIYFKCDVIKRFWFTAHENCTLSVQSNGLFFWDGDDPTASCFYDREELRGASVSKQMRDLIVVFRDGKKFEVGFGMMGDQPLMDAAIAALRRIV